MIRIGALEVNPSLKKVVEEECLPGSGISSSSFWAGLEQILSEFGPENEALLRKRDSIQAEIDAYYLSRLGKPINEVEYAGFLGKLGYLIPEGPEFTVETQNVDPEIASTPGPQLVCPCDNARFLLNACNARYGSLLDACYGTDIVSEEGGATKGPGYNPVRGDKVFQFAHAFLDENYPLQSGGKYGDVAEYKLNNKSLEFVLKNKTVVKLADPDQFVGFTQNGSTLTNVVLKHNGLHLEIQFDPSSPIGKHHAAGIKDIILESAITAIADCEDSVASVDGQDKAKCYRNWNGLMKGQLEEKFNKGGKVMTRKMNQDKTFTCPKSGKPITLKGRVLLLVRNVGIHIMTNMVRFADTKREVPEGLVDALVTTVSAMHDINGKQMNSAKKSMYIVKPKLHGVEEVQFTVRLFDRVEQILGLPQNTIKMGIMDEERRTTVNLKECIRAAKERCIFINTGFLDRTGDEIHTCFRAGPVLPKGDIKKAAWRLAYEDWNVDVGIETGLIGRGQIGKGMWAAPDKLKQMLNEKIGHPKAGGTTAWCPSPVAATLHAIHYHQVNVFDVQERLKSRPRASLADILTPPLLGDKTLSNEEIQHELQDNLQGLLGYISRWILLGVGCSKVPDINNVGLMEDLATLRISSQHVGNWLHHGVVTEEQVMETAKKMAAFVDEQNKGVAGYQPMSPQYNNNAFKAAMETVFSACETANGYTDYCLTKYRRAEKQRLSTSKI